MAKKVLSVGQCMADHWGISRTLQMHFEVEVVSAASAAEALHQLRHESFALVLVNRIFDADGDSGLTFIQHVKTTEDVAHVPIMLVSNYANHQQQAEQYGAVPGFGKADLNRPEMLDRVRPVLGG